MKSLQNNLIYVVKSVNWILIPDTNLFVILDMLVGIKIVSKSGLGLDIKLEVGVIPLSRYMRLESYG